MTFFGGLNFNTGFCFGNWYMPAFSSFNCFPSFSSFAFPVFNFSPFNMQNIWSDAYNSAKTLKKQVVDKPKENPVAKEYYLPTLPQTPSVDTFTPTKPKTKLKQNTDNVALDGYNSKAGQKLANIALDNSVGWTGYCARSVKTAIQQANLGTYQYGHAYQMPSIMRNNKNFKEISVDSVDVSKLPAGCVLVYGRGKEGYSKDYGHTEITTGDGRAVSDGITKNLYKKPSAIFMPVERNLYA